MKIEEKLIAKKMLIVLTAVNFSIFLLYYFARFLSVSSSFAYAIMALLVLLKYANKTILPMMVATASLIAYAEYGIKGALLRSLTYSASWLAYAFPYYAFYFADGGLVIDKVLIYTSLLTIATFVVVYSVSLLTFGLMIFITKKFACRKTESYCFEEELKKSGSCDFSLPITVGIFSGALLLFICNIAIELAFTTIPYIIDVKTSFRVGEIIYMVIYYIFILALLLISYFSAYRVKKLYK